MIVHLKDHEVRRSSSDLALVMLSDGFGVEEDKDAPFSAQRSDSVGEYAVCGVRGRRTRHRG